MKNPAFTAIASALTLAFMCVSVASADTTSSTIVHGARNTEPYSCTASGRTFNPEQSSITIDAATGDIIAGDNIDALRYPASMTKMMTVAVIFDALRDGRLSLTDEITVSISTDVENTRSNSRSTWMNSGEKMTVQEAILAITVASANNVSVIMAEQLAGSEDEFVALMNEKADEIGMTRTVFRNATGLPDRQQVSTARDIGKLALYLNQEYPEYYHFFSAKTAEFGQWRGARAKYNHNELTIKNPNIDGIKTGFICDSGYNLATSATSGGDRIITVVFGGRTPHQRNEATKDMIEEGFETMVANRQSGAPTNLANLSDDEVPADELQRPIIADNEPLPTETDTEIGITPGLLPPTMQKS